MSRTRQSACQRTRRHFLPVQWLSNPVQWHSSRSRGTCKSNNQRHFHAEEATHTEQSAENQSTPLQMYVLFSMQPIAFLRLQRELNRPTISSTYPATASQAASSVAWMVTPGGEGGGGGGKPAMCVNVHDQFSNLTHYKNDRPKSPQKGKECVYVRVGVGGRGGVCVGDRRDGNTA